MTFNKDACLITYVLYVSMFLNSDYIQGLSNLIQKGPTWVQVFIPTKQKLQLVKFITEKSFEKSEDKC